MALSALSWIGTWIAAVCDALFECLHMSTNSFVLCAGKSADPNSAAAILENILDMVASRIPPEGLIGERLFTQ